MSQKESISYTLYPEYLTATGYLNDEVSKIGYVEHQDVRDAVMDVMDVLVTGYEREIFASICGRCGRCCIDRTVPVTSREIGSICRHLDLSERDFRKRYTLPAATWNEQDGILVLKDTKCIFLEQGSSGTCKCTIYAVRPSACSQISPSRECCRKDPGKLLTCVEKLEIWPQSLTCHLASGHQCPVEHRTTQLQEALGKLSEAVHPHLGEEQNQLEQISGVAHQILDWLMQHHKSGASREILMPRFLSIKEIIEDIETLTQLREKDPEDLELLWSRFRHFSRLMGSGNEAVSESADGPCADLPVVICLQPAALSIEIQSGDKPSSATLHYHEHPGLLGLVREFIGALVTSGEPGLIDVLGHAEPACNLCGVCCGSYDLEANAADIERIADYLKISEKEVWEKYLIPGVRSWNRRDGFIRRQRKEHYDGECVFLRVKSPTESVCGMYEGRPRICREYEANTRLCKRQNLLLKGHEHIGYIISCQVAGDTILLTTHHTQSQNKEPFAMDMKDYDRLRELFGKVRAGALQILERSGV